MSKERNITSVAPDEVKSVVDKYTGLYEGDIKKRKAQHQLIASHYYDLVTDLYEFGWGQSFHFAPRLRGESFKASLLRHEYFIADQLSLRPGMEVLDVGCGVGGPMRNIALYSGASITGISNNAGHIERAKVITRNVPSPRNFIYGDYMQIPVSDDSFDGAFTIESTPHAPDKTALFREILRILRPRACFAGYEYCMTSIFDTNNKVHKRIKQDLELGGGIPEITGQAEVCAAIRSAGFELLDICDLAPRSDPQTSWYRALEGRDFSLASIPRTPTGRTLVNWVLRTGEMLRILPKGTTEVSTMLNRGADAFVEAGRAGIFTPMLFFLARKPG